MTRQIALTIMLASSVALADNPKTGKGTEAEQAQQATEIKNGKDVYCNREADVAPYFPVLMDGDPMGEAWARYWAELHRAMKMGK